MSQLKGAKEKGVKSIFSAQFTICVYEDGRSVTYFYVLQLSAIPSKILFSFFSELCLFLFLRLDSAIRLLIYNNV